MTTFWWDAKSGSKGISARWQVFSFGWKKKVSNKIIRFGCFLNDMSKRKRWRNHFNIEWNSSKNHWRGKFYYFLLKTIEIGIGLKIFKAWYFLNQIASDCGCSIIQTDHLRHSRLLGDTSLIIVDDLRCDWILLINYRTSAVTLHKSSDSASSDGEILNRNLKPLITGMC